MSYPGAAYKQKQEQQRQQQQLQQQQQGGGQFFGVYPGGQQPQMVPQAPQVSYVCPLLSLTEGKGASALSQLVEDRRVCGRELGGNMLIICLRDERWI
jgi:hypothetical protein